MSLFLKITLKASLYDKSVLIKLSLKSVYKKIDTASNSSDSFKVLLFNGKKGKFIYDIAPAEYILLYNF